MVFTAGKYQVMAIDLLDIEPFEICSIRPPTENYSITFRLTRNCYWNRCVFCPVYKTGARFSRRSLDEVLLDIGRAKLIDDMMFENGIGLTIYSDADYPRVRELAQHIRRQRWEAGYLDNDDEDAAPVPSDMDERMQWFMTWFKDRPVLEDSLEHVLTWRIGGGKTCFLGDGDNLILKPAFISGVAAAVKRNFPSIERFTIYGRTKTAAQQRSLKELKAFARAGIERVHFGMESGSDRVLSLVCKGETSQDHVTGCRKAREGGLSPSVYIMPGLGGNLYSEEHARETACVINEAAPDYVRLRTLEIFPGTPLARMAVAGEFAEATEEQVVREIRVLVEAIEIDTVLYSDSASNLLDVKGRLPNDREEMLAVIDSYLSLSSREKLIYSFRSRLQSFLGQYGALSGDLYTAIAPYIRQGRIDLDSAHDDEIASLIRHIRSKLMP